MNSTLTSPNPFFTPFLNPSSFNFSPPHHHRRRRRFHTRVTLNSSHITNKPRVFHKQPPPTTAGLNYTHQPQDNNKVSLILSNAIKQISKPIAFTVFSIAIGLLFPSLGFHQKPLIAIAAPVASEGLKTNRRKGKQVSNWKEHEFSEYTRRLLETVSVLVRVIEEVRSGNGELKSVEVVLNDVKLKKKEVQDELMKRLYSELWDLRAPKLELERQAAEILDSVMKCKKDRDKILEKSGKKEGRDVKEVARLEEMISDKEKEFDGILEEVGKIEDQMFRRETMALSIGVRELCFIERESVVLVENFIREMKQKDTDR